jgi:hypothetical protein
MTTFYCLRFETLLTWRTRSPYLYPPWDRVAQLYSQVLTVLFFASNDSQGYGGGIKTRLHTGIEDTERRYIYIYNYF